MRTSPYPPGLLLPPELRAARLAQRATAVALVPLTLWFVASILADAGSDYTELIFWLRMLFIAGGMILLLIGLFRHAAALRIALDV